MSSSAIIALLIAGSSPQAEAGISTVQIAPDGLLRVGDLARVSRGAELVVLRAADNTLLTPGQQAQLVRNRLPGAVFALRYKQAIRLALPERPAKTEFAACLTAAILIPADHVLEQADVAAAPCDVRTQGGWLRPVAGGFQARVDIPPGTQLGRPYIAAHAPVAAATPVVVRTKVGPVTIERNAETVQAARPGRSVFARTEDGAVLVAPLATSQEEQDQ